MASQARLVSDLGSFTDDISHGSQPRFSSGTWNESRASPLSNSFKKSLCSSLYASVAAAEMKRNCVVFLRTQLVFMAKIYIIPVWKSINNIHSETFIYPLDD